MVILNVTVYPSFSDFTNVASLAVLEDLGKAQS